MPLPAATGSRSSASSRSPAGARRRRRRRGRRLLRRRLVRRRPARPLRGPRGDRRIRAAMRPRTSTAASWTNNVILEGDGGGVRSATCSAASAAPTAALRRRAARPLRGLHEAIAALRSRLEGHEAIAAFVRAHEAATSSRRGAARAHPRPAGAGSGGRGRLEAEQRHPRRQVVAATDKQPTPAAPASSVRRAPQPGVRAAPRLGTARSTATPCSGASASTASIACTA